MVQFLGSTSVCEKLMAAGQGQGLRYAPFRDFLRCVHNPDLQPLSPVKDSVVVLKIIECAYLSASKGGIPIEIK